MISVLPSPSSLSTFFTLHKCTKSQSHYISPLLTQTVFFFFCWFLSVQLCVRATGNRVPRFVDSSSFFIFGRSGRRRKKKFPVEKQGPVSFPYCLETLQLIQVDSAQTVRVNYTGSYYGAVCEPRETFRPAPGSDGPCSKQFLFRWCQSGQSLTPV